MQSARFLVFFIHGVADRNKCCGSYCEKFFPRVYMNSVCLIFWALPVVPNLRHRETHITLNLEDDLGTLNKLIRKVEQIFNNNVKNTERLIVWLLNKSFIL